MEKVNQLLGEIGNAGAKGDWKSVEKLSKQVLSQDPQNSTAIAPSGGVHPGAGRAVPAKELLEEGLAVAEELFIGDRTVVNHVSRIFEKGERSTII